MQHFRKLRFNLSGIPISHRILKKKCTKGLKDSPFRNAARERSKGAQQGNLMQGPQVMP